MEQRKVNRKYFFISDVHLGLRYGNWRLREKQFADFLLSLPQDTEEIYLLGDIFDFWYEYQHVIPRGYTRTLGAFAVLRDRGVKIHFFNGNHDIWTYNYFQEELGFIVEKQPALFEIEGKRFVLGHGDDIEKRDFGYQFLRGVFTSRLAQFLFSMLHPYLAFSFGLNWSKHNRLAKADNSYTFNCNREPLYKYCVKQVESGAYGPSRPDCFIFGHFHASTDVIMPECGSRFIILGDWIHNPSYVLFDGEHIEFVKL